MPAALRRRRRAPPKNATGSSTAIGVDHQTPRIGTVPETLTAFEPLGLLTPTAIRPRWPTVFALETALSESVAGSTDTVAGLPAFGPGRIPTRTTLSL